MDWTDDERVVLNAMRSAAGFGSDDDAIRVALWRLAQHLGLAVPRGAFDVGYRRGMKRLLDAERALRAMCYSDDLAS